jgi:hypothetical protein
VAPVANQIDADLEIRTQESQSKQEERLLSYQLERHRHPARAIPRSNGHDSI